MDFDTWLTKWRFVKSRTEIIALSEKLEPQGNDPRHVFDAMVTYCSGNYEYNVSDFGLLEAFKRRQLCCTTACNLVIGVILYLTKEDFDVKPYGIFGGNTAVITPKVERAGVRVKTNMIKGGGRMLFSKSHYVAEIDNAQYDLITGLRAHNINFRDPRIVDPIDGKPTFQCELEGEPRFVTQVGDMDTGLALYKVEPPIT